MNLVIIILFTFKVSFYPRNMSINSRNIEYVLRIIFFYGDLSDPGYVLFSL